MKRQALAISASLLMVAACGGGGEKDTGGSSSGGGDGGQVTVSATANELGCAPSVDAASDRELFVADSGTCSLDGVEVKIYRFSNNETRDNWIKTATQFGIGRFVVFDRGVVTSTDQGAADKVKAKIGGDIRT